MIYLGADHRGFGLKEAIKQHLATSGLAFEDVGAKVLDQSDDYVTYASAVARAVASDPDQNQGVVICRSGVGVDVTANKVHGIRSALCASPEQAAAARDEDNANVLALAADFVDQGTALAIVDRWLATPFSGAARHVRRLQALSDMEGELSSQH